MIPSKPMADDKRAVTRSVILDLVDQGFMFTALDVSNEVKLRVDARHREISPLVRELFDEGILGDEYTRTLIDVLAGGKTVQAYLYYHEDDDPEDYDGSLREQKARPPGQRVPSGNDAPAAANVANKPKLDLNVDELTLYRERDGSIEIPVGFLQRAGIYDRTVHLDAAHFGSGLVITSPDPSKDPLAVLDVSDAVVIPADRLSAYDGSKPVHVRVGARQLDLEGTLR